MNKKPTDPLTGEEYIYSRTYGWNEYEILSLYESDLITLNNNLLSKTNWASRNFPKISWNYNWIYVKANNYYVPTPTIINGNTWGNINLSENLTFFESQVTTWWDNIPWVSTWWLVWMSVEVFSWTLDVSSWEDQNGNKALLAQALIDAYSWTILANDWIYKEIVETSSENLVSLVDNYVLKISNGWGEQTTGLITSTDCLGAWWIWVDSTYDVYIGSTQWNWFCISPIFWDWNDDSNSWNWWISWNGWWDNGISRYQWWDADSIDDNSNNRPDYWQTRKLDSEISYDCKVLWSASNDYDIEDTIVWRMKWLATTWNIYEEARSIDWITWLVPHTLWTYPHVIPALYIADCIDWVKDLWTDMEYKHYPDENLNETITYVEYNNNATSHDVDTIALDGITYQNRQKYLTAWTQKSWSHLPSAFSYIEDWTAWWELKNWSTTDWDFYQSDESKWEYQVACENEYLWVTTWNWSTQYTWWEDQLDDEWIWLSAIGDTTGIGWGRNARIVGRFGCWDQYQNDTGTRYKLHSARFVVRP